MNATSSGLTAAPISTPFTITVGPASQMVFSGPTSIVQNDCSGPYTLTIKDAGGNTAINSSASTWDISLSSTDSAAIYGTSACSSPISQIGIASQQSISNNFYVKNPVL